jgi:hypothetical protein
MTHRVDAQCEARCEKADGQPDQHHDEIGMQLRDPADR